MSDRPGWRVERLVAPASVAHADDLTSEVAGRLVRFHEVTRPALVLGSAQRDEVVDRRAVAAAGVEVVRRRSGGGAVLLVPGEVLWVDIVIPAGDPLWHDDVGRAMHWVGDVWARVLRAVAGIDATVHQGGLVRTAWSSLVCFAGLGAGEVTLEGRKVVGISQRRSRAGARFQIAVLLRWDAAAIVELLALAAADRARAADELAAMATGVPASRDAGGRPRGDVLAAALLDALPT